MQAGTLNVLMGMVAAPAGGDAPLSGAEEESVGQGFEQLFGQLMQEGFGQQGAGNELLSGSGQASPLLQKMTLTAASAAALSAQEISTSASEAGTAASQALLQHVVTAQEAPAILSRIDQAIQQASPSDAELLNQLRTQVAAIQQGSAPKTVAQLVAPLVQAKLSSTPSSPSGLSRTDLAALIVPHKTKNDEQTAPSPTTEAPTHEADIWQAVQAGMFRLTHGKVKAEAASATPKEEKELVADTGESHDTLVTLVQPLTQTLEISVPATPEANTDQEKIAADSVDDIDTVIPPLSLGLNDTSATSLPAVQLPSMAATQALVSQPEKSDATQVASVGERREGKASDVALAGDLRAAVLDENAETQGGKEQAKNATGFSAELSKATGDNSANLTASAASVVVPGHTAAVTHPRTINLTPTPGYVNQAPVSEQVRVAISKAGKEGADKITIQLDPADLGRVEVKLHAASDGTTQIQFTIDKPETFDSLSRDARHLERTLQEAGIKADTGSMQFNLRQQPQQQQNLQADVGGQGQSKQQAPNPQPQASNEQNETTAVAVSIPTLTNHYILNVREGVDISA